MPISSEYINIVEKISKKIKIPRIKEIIVPKRDLEFKKSNFATVVLDDDTIGVFFINLTNKVRQRFYESEFSYLEETETIELAKLFESKELFERSIGLGGINAVSQFLFKKSKYNFDYTSDPLGLLKIKKQDIVGIVGFFPPLIKHMEEIGNKLIVIEKKEELVKKGYNWEVTLDPSELKICNKVLITSTTVLNDTIDDILKYCANSEKLSMVGPTAGFLPDPLFERGIDIIGGSQVTDSNLFIQSIKNNYRWAGSVKKYIIKKPNYPGFTGLITNL